MPEVGITASDATISLRIFARGPTPSEAQAQIAPVEATIRERLGDLVFGVDDEELQHAVVRLLAREAADAGDGRERDGGPGRRSGWRRCPARAPGSAAASSPTTTGRRCELLGVPQELIDEHGAVSAAVAEAMAVGCRRGCGTDLAVSTSGVAGPGGGGAGPAGGAGVRRRWRGRAA